MAKSVGYLPNLCATLTVLLRLAMAYLAYSPAAAESSLVIRLEGTMTASKPDLVNRPITQWHELCHLDFNLWGSDSPKLASLSSGVLLYFP